MLHGDEPGYMKGLRTQRALSARCRVLRLLTHHYGHAAPMIDKDGGDAISVCGLVMQWDVATAIAYELEAMGGLEAAPDGGASIPLGEIK